MNEKLEIMKNGKGFIAALDQSGGSSGKTLRLYGIAEDKYSTDEEMFNLIHEMRTRVIKSNSFTSDKIIGVILFEKTMNGMIDGEYTSEYLWNNKHILSFLKVDKGLADEEDGVQVMKDIPGLEDTLKTAVSHGVFGTKMRSVIKSANAEGIKKVVKQQFDIARVIASFGLVPIIEPEVSINAPDKEECERILKEEVKKELADFPSNVMFKFTIPTVDNYYADLMEYENVVRIVALSGGYTCVDACDKLSRNNGMIASFSRALLESLRVTDTEEEFDQKLKDAIDMIYEASIK